MKKLYLTEENKKNVLDELIKRSPNHYGEFETKVAEIVNNVRENGDAAIFEYTKEGTAATGHLCIGSTGIV